VKARARIRRLSIGWPHLIFAAVLLLRLVSLARLTSSPFLLPSRGDMHFYNDWAQRILDGGLTEHLAFYGLPGYAYVLALLYKIFGYNPFVPGLIQAILDPGTAVLMYLVTLRIFPHGSKGGTSDSHGELHARITGAIASLGWAFFVPAQAYAVVLMPTTWFVFVFWLVVWRITRSDGPPRLTECFWLGFLIGITATAVANILVLVPLVLAALIIKPKIDNFSRWRSFTVGAALLIVGLGLGTSPCWIHNYVVARDPVFLSAHSGINFWIGNNPDANGYPRFPPGLRAGQAAMLQDSITQAESAAGRALQHSEVSAYWSAKAKAYITAHFGDWLRLLTVKLRNFWSAFQYDDLSVITSLREQCVIFSGLYFGVIAALAIPGLFFAAVFSSRSRLAIAAVLLSLIGLLGVFITERYRLVAVPGLLIFAAYGLSIFWKSCASGRIKTAAVYLALLIGSMIVVSWPQRAPSLWALDAYNSGWQALESNNPLLAEKKLAIAYAYVPTNSETNFALGNLRLAQNQTEDARLFYRATLRIDPHHKGALNNLGVISFEAANFEEARQYFEEALAQAPRDAKAHYLLAKTFYAENNQPAAREAIDRALSLNSRQQEFIDLKGKIEEMPPK
jgi:tetratricopeptide (TPR) repeat protein